MKYARLLFALIVTTLLVYPSPAVAVRQYDPPASSVSIFHSEEVKPVISLITYNQGDPRWGAKLMQPSSLSLDRWGCMVAAFAMRLKNSSIPDDPGQVTDKFVNAGVFDSHGNFIQQNVSLAYPEVHFKERVYTTNEGNPAIAKMDIKVAIKKIHRYIDLGQPVLINVDLIGNDKNSDHWVVAYGYTDTDLLINDPAFGETTMFSKRYGTPETGVYGYAAFIASPIDFNEDGDPPAGSSIAKLADAKALIDSSPFRKFLGSLIGFSRVSMDVNESIDSLLSV